MALDRITLSRFRNHGETALDGTRHFNLLVGENGAGKTNVLEAISLCEEITGKTLDWTYVDDNRVGDHIWWIGDNGRFAEHYPSWELTYDVPAILTEMYDANRQRWA